MGMYRHIFGTNQCFVLLAMHTYLQIYMLPITHELFTWFVGIDVHVYFLFKELY